MDTKHFSETCPQYKQPSRYLDYSKYPIFYHPCTIDGEGKSTWYNKGKITWSTPENIGFFSYSGDWKPDTPDIVIEDFTWPISGDLRFDIHTDDFVHDYVTDIGKLVDIKIPLGWNEYSHIGLKLKKF